MTNSVAESLANELLEVQRTLGWMDLIIGSISDAVYVTDSESRIVFANQYFSNLLNIQRVFLLGHTLNEVFDVTLNNEFTEEFQNESKIPQAPDGTITAIYTWQTYNKNYVFKISRRELATTKQTVYLAQDITREHELSQMKTSFINLASHQLRTPMTAIMTYSHMLHDGYAGEVTPKQKELTQSIVRSSERMSRLINEILNITKLQSTDTVLFVQKIAIKPLLTDIIKELKPRLKRQNLAISIDIPSRLHAISGNKEEVYEILSNIIVNAIQYTPAGVSIQISAKATTNKVSVSVSDTGIGIPKEYIEKIFDQFSRADNAFKVFNEGTGLGLYLVKLLVLRNHASIDCQSELNKGATFTVTFPIFDSTI